MTDNHKVTVQARLNANTQPGEDLALEVYNMLLMHHDARTIVRNALLALGYYDGTLSEEEVTDFIGPPENPSPRSQASIIADKVVSMLADGSLVLGDPTDETEYVDMEEIWQNDASDFFDA